MNTIFIELLNKKYNNQFVIETNENNSFIRFPAKCADFGDICIYEDEPGGYIVEVGNFTHGHYDLYEGTEDEMTKEAAEDIIDFLEKLFSDSVICYGSHKGGGGWYLKEDDKSENIDWTDLFVWSGLFRKSKNVGG